MRLGLGDHDVALEMSDLHHRAADVADEHVAVFRRLRPDGQVTHCDGEPGVVRRDLRQVFGQRVHLGGVRLAGMASLVATNAVSPSERLWFTVTCAG